MTAPAGSGAATPPKTMTEVIEARAAEWDAEAERVREAWGERYALQAESLARELRELLPAVREHDAAVRRLVAAVKEAASAPGKDWLGEQLKLGAALIEFDGAATSGGGE